ncbi:hypothetical protein TVAG_483330 [Trichomonas vaginalis G3]|uniref:Uncharacterized protein n=1 Tax=Trichomonas vaginalis (strain ATCC PRA-98 / G3) TaxID=412133 RepID=A2ETA6_TRIV3|nr:WD40 repeat-like family [Trichomonas vaginalis G3]EAY04096.1 hypothetical protein TVAG_483330 [Trichomonas vaginalis G3]KAI5503846.1 WD40 repeat-like family [Trichomonas vaginalis G3]|eukprot:XP_001316319.1 hypothetical protein [Trichomonas vaginalis G3]
MGLFNSIPKRIKELHFSKDLSTLFNSARIRSDFPYTIFYLGNTTCYKAEPASDLPFYFLVTKENEVHALTYDISVPMSHHSLQIEEEVIHVAKLQNSIHALTLKSGKIAVITNYADKFERKDYFVKNAYISLPLDETQFLSVGTDYSIVRVPFSGEISYAMQPIRNISEPPIDALVVPTNPQLVALISDKILIVCSLGHYGVTTYPNLGEGFVKLGVINPNSLLVLADKGKCIYFIKLTIEGKLEGEKTKIPPSGFPEPMTMFETHDRTFSDPPMKGNVSLAYLCNGKSITCIDSNMFFMQYQLPEDKTATHIFQLNSIPHNILLVACNDGSVILIRLSQDRGANTVGSFYHYELQNLHNAPIKYIHSAIPIMFMTIDENNKTVAWESFPNWWWAPNYFDMFKGVINEGESNDSMADTV